VRGGQVIIESAIAEADSLRKVLKRRSSERVNSADEKQIARATALAWFNNNRADLAGTSRRGSNQAN